MWYPLIQETVAKSAVGKIFKTTFTEAGSRIVSILPKAKSGTPRQLGWASSLFQGLFKKVSDLFKEGGALRGAIKQIKSWADSALKGVLKLDKALMAEKKTFIGKTIKFFYDLFRSSFTTPFGLLMTAGGKVASSATKLSKEASEREKTKQQNAAAAVKV
jgi:hypothetical protein